MILKAFLRMLSMLDILIYNFYTSIYQSICMKELTTNQVYELRMKAEVTQEELAEAVGVTRQTIIAIEKGNYTPSVLLALKVAKFFKKSLEEAFNIKYEK